MLQAFLSSWELFQNSYWVGWFIAVALALNGFLLVSRNQIFYGAAVSQASTLGVAVGLMFSELPEVATFMAILFSILAALLMAERQGRASESREAVTGWVFLLASSLSILLVCQSPHGLEEIHRLQASSLIGAISSDVWIFGAILVATIILVLRFRKQLLLYVMDQEMAQSVGIPIGRWSFLIALWLGVVVGLCIRTTGMLYTFGCLILPGLAAKSLSRELGQFFILAPIIALALSFIGFVAANYYDFPPAQMTTAFFAIFLGGIWLLARGN